MKCIDVFTDSIKVKDRASFKKAINEKLMVIDGDSLNETVKEIRAHISLIERQQEHFIADIRQEVNNCIEKYNGWLAFWISILAVLCGIIPVLLQYMGHRTKRLMLRSVDFDESLLISVS